MMPRSWRHLSYGASADVITAMDLETMFKSAEVKKPSNGQPVKSVAFILCAGSRDPDHLPYCSSACCVESLKQAKYFKEADPQTQVYIFYKDIRSTGNYELLYKQLQKDGLIFVRGAVTGIDDDGSGGLVITSDDVLTRSSGHVGKRRPGRTGDRHGPDQRPGRAFQGEGPPGRRRGAIAGPGRQRYRFKPSKSPIQAGAGAARPRLRIPRFPLYLLSL